MRILRTFLMAAMVAQLFAVAASAAPITFYHFGTGSGTLNGNSFNSQFKITALGDTLNRQSCGGNCFFIDHGTVQIELVSLSLVSTITTPTRTFMNNFSGGGVVGFSRAGIGGADLFDGPYNLPFWDMLGAFGPVTGQADLIQWSSSAINTNNGVLVFSNSTTTGTFEAVTGGNNTVPEPASLLMLSIGLFGLAVRRRTR